MWHNVVDINGYHRTRLFFALNLFLKHHCFLNNSLILRRKIIHGIISSGTTMNKKYVLRHYLYLAMKDVQCYIDIR